ncbi:MAG: calcium-translocating P-type ATPase, PMCA-type [Spirochaetes bacterium]|nr:calcium-translocating P-type ATPase, PMCA-type [Spirochaetota bacterium]
MKNGTAGVGTAAFGHTAWHTESAEAVVRELETDVSSGLTESEAGERMARYGPNRLEEKRKKPLLFLFFEQLNSMLIFILVAAAAVSAVLGETTDTAVIVCVILLNAFIGVIQEAKAQKELEALEKLSAPNALVLREGIKREIPSEAVVPGDVILIDAGRIMPCDLRLVESVNLKIGESALTGESVPSEKDAGATAEMADTPLGDQKNMAFMTTVATFGRGVGVAVATGMSTEIGRIATMLGTTKRELTPLQKKLDLLGRRLGGIILAICAFIFLFSLLRPLLAEGGIGKSHLIELLLTSISLAVAAIPEGLPAIVTIVLAVGVRRMVKKNAIIRSLPAVETLGSVTVICTDKTGTLTLNRMTVHKAFTDGGLCDVSKLDPANKPHRMLLSALVLCNDAAYTPDSRAGDPTEIALLEAGYRHGMQKETLDRAHPRVSEIPFDSDRKLMSTVHEYDGRYAVMTKGALDRLLPLCGTVLSGEGEVFLDDETRSRYLAGAEKMADGALRVLACAFKLTDRKPEERLEEGLCLAGIVGMIDPPRLEVKDSIARCEKSGIRTVMITGDHKHTAYVIARELGIASDPSQAISGSELDALSEEGLRRLSGSIRVYARVSPAHKMRIVRALKSEGNVVSMTGDGVNDAPSLKEADIGVAMGITGTDVAKDASDMVLTDDNYQTIVSAIEEGRNIYNNIKRSVLFLLSCNAGEIIAIFFCILLGWPVPLLPVHILWVNLITDTLPALSLGMEPGDPDVLDEKPRSPTESLFAGGGTAEVVGNGILIGILALVAYRVGAALHPGSLVHARTLAFAVLSLTQLFHAFNLKHATRSVFGSGAFRNTLLLFAVGFGIALQVSVISITPLARIFRVVPLDANGWLIAAGIGFTPILFNEVVKLVRRWKSGK